MFLRYFSALLILSTLPLQAGAAKKKRVIKPQAKKVMETPAPETVYPPPIGKKLIGGVIPVPRYKGDDYKVVDVKTLKQPPELAASIKAMTTGTLEQRIAALKEKTLRDLVFVKGGRFWMGDFGIWHHPDGLPYTRGQGNDIFEVEIDSYSIGKYKVTYAEFDVYTDAVKKPRIASDETQIHIHRADNPAGASWYDVKDYCKWLAGITGLPIDLPTEAQWEYAARSGGQYILFPTDNGQLEMGRNVAEFGQREALQPMHPIFGQSGMSPFTIALFPPTPLGLYDLAQNGLEWVEDWYAPYPKSGKDPIKNPKGPAVGEKKAARGWPNQDDLAGDTVHRRKYFPTTSFITTLDGETFFPGYRNDCFRIVVNQSTMVKR